VGAGWLRVAVLACSFAASAAVAATDFFPHLAGAYLVQVGGRDLWAGHADARLSPASLTKIMTALVVLDDYHPQDVITVSESAARATGSRLRLGAGDKFTVQALLTATLIASANDACAALAESAAGSVEAFVARMNERARSLGLANTHFANPCGLDAPAHHSSANDLARITHAALDRAEFADLVAKPQAHIATIDGKRRFQFKNKNALIGSYAPAIGVKSGYTSRAGKCLIVLAQKDGVRVMLVMLNAKSRWWDAIGVIENAFDHARVNVAQ